MTRIFADNEHLAVASDDFAFVAHFLDRRTYLHDCFLSVLCLIYLLRPAADENLLRLSYLPACLLAFAAFATSGSPERFMRGLPSHNLHRAPIRPADLVLLIPVRDAPSIQIVDRKFNGHFVSRQYFDVMHTHLAGYVRQYLVAVFKLYPKHCVWQRLKDGALELDDILFGQKRSLKKKIIRSKRI